MITKEEEKEFKKPKLYKIWNFLIYRSFFAVKQIFFRKDNDFSYFSYQLMNISPHLLIDAVILSAALTITLVLRAKGNAARKEKVNK